METVLNFACHCDESDQDFEWHLEIISRIVAAVWRLVPFHKDVWSPVSSWKNRSLWREVLDDGASQI
jgi:hypothetical protein